MIKTNGKNQGRAKQRKVLADYEFNIGSTDFTIVKEFIVNHIRKTYEYGDDIAKALETKKEMDFDSIMPVLDSKKIVADPKTEEDKATNMHIQTVHTSRVEKVIDREAKYESNKGNAYALLLGQYSKVMKHNIKSRQDFDSNVDGNPIALLKAIEEHSVCYQENKFCILIVIDALKALINLKQKENEPLIDYIKRFKSSCDVVTAQLGGNLKLKKCMKSLSLTEDETYEAFKSCLLLVNADSSKYGSLIRSLSSQYSLKNDQYPRTLVATNNVLSNHRFDKSSKGKFQKKTDHSEKDKDKVEESNPELSFAQMEGVCYCCGKAGHRSNKCQYRDKPKEEWHINKVKGIQNLMKSEKKEDASWCGIQHTLKCLTQEEVTQNDSLLDKILLDSQSSIDLFANKNLVTDIQPADKELMLSTNAGQKMINKKAYVPDYGWVYFDEDAVANVFSMAKMRDKFRVSYDENEDALVVHHPKKSVQFKRGEDNLYTLKAKYNTKTCLVETVEDNKAFYTKRQVEKAKQARQLLHTLGFPTVNDMKVMIKMNSVSNCPVTIEDVELAEKIYGKDVASLKGKTVRRKPNPVVNNMIELPPELMEAQGKVEICFDILYINELPFLTTVSKNILYRTIEYLPNEKMMTIKKALESVISIYKYAGFVIEDMSSDKEFKPLAIALKDEHHITLNLASAQEHEPHVERSIRVIKERIRAQIHQLPYTSLPKNLIKYLVMEATRKLNFFPPKHGISKYYSPREILHRQKLEYHKHCLIPTLSYVQAHDDDTLKKIRIKHELSIVFTFAQVQTNREGMS